MRIHFHRGKKGRCYCHGNECECVAQEASRRKEERWVVVRQLRRLISRGGAAEQSSRV